MTSEILFIIIITIVVLDFFVEQILEYLNASWFNKPIPEILKDIYDTEKYKKQQSYKSENYRFGIISSSFSFILIVLMLVFNGFAYVDTLAGQISENFILKPLVFFGIILLAMDILSTPFSVYDTFVIENKYGFNKTTVKTYILDKIKTYLLGGTIGAGLFALILWIYHLDPEYFWLYACLVIIAFSLFMNMFYSTLIVPLFNKQTPLEDGELKTKIMEFSKKAGFNISKIFVIDGSKRSTKANAYFSGIGPKKRIVLYDTLINEMTNDEILAVLAHEIGHYKHKHIYWSMIAGIIEIGIMFYIFGLFASSDMLSQALGLEKASFHIALIAFSIIYSPISSAFAVVSSIFSRKAEYQADNFASKHGLSNELISALKKLSSHNMSNLTPHPWVVFMTYSHPPVFNRIKALMKH
ncbi:MAG: M48 family metallopeptidase [Bacteroidota bacterium]|jgi:STE24 endopeptidase|nr:M48 family metallopeptidase [Bacteroidales bacterium]MDI9535913.1 M48 family metallopeptidase [Bacteroidota bacterium]OQC46036.1 MAG: Protease HtpX [Bacteroidetes bacterium ADurb.Bin028]HOD87714.1 M48 family metallopeptidase [Bacteroidales bacterium]